jgi:hypothetical protein
MRVISKHTVYFLNPSRFPGDLAFDSPMARLGVEEGKAAEILATSISSNWK